MRRLLTSLAATALMLALAGPPALAQDSLRLTGSGASFPFPIYSAWFKAFSTKAKAISVDYQGKGSGAGVQDFLNRTVDFAASDAAMTDEQMAKVPGGVQLLPMTAGEIVLRPYGRTGLTYRRVVVGCSEDGTEPQAKGETGHA